MVDKKHLSFDSILGGTKPITVINSGDICPFCHRDQLEGILAEEGPILFLVNKYPVLQDTYQTVLIETYDCDAELSTYSREHLHKVIRFGVEKWQEMMQSGQFASVLFYKNHGPYSGGTIRHPHMQIVGLKNIDYTPNISRQSLHGEIIDCDTGVELNLTREPQVGFYEFNVRLENLQYIDRMADYIQIVTHYLLHYFNKHCKSYNLFFYQIDGIITVKIMPRFITSPLFIGYGIPQVSCQARQVVKEIQKIYL
ncbi:Hypothetical protein LUCI_2295 [Lucifera butyrica]|uniref:DUF4931 domain-containing protein n=1 Tax=Lucifera butyrica TaxID=1351585 RepID=A0A498R6R8_9FIRM|nr:DUF4931 domain-containing protein [Lucifera butyrica]VBB07051.1 Hypothetical protein LUCI_2295 [Lucifera butyrica]